MLGVPSLQDPRTHHGKDATIQQAVLTCCLILALVTPVSFDRISIAFFSLDSRTRLQPDSITGR
jgi:hypothetical protein